MLGSFRRSCPLCEKSNCGEILRAGRKSNHIVKPTHVVPVVSSFGVDLLDKVCVITNRNNKPDLKLVKVLRVVVNLHQFILANISAKDFSESVHCGSHPKIIAGHKK